MSWNPLFRADRDSPKYSTLASVSSFDVEMISKFLAYSSLVAFMSNLSAMRSKLLLLYIEFSRLMSIGGWDEKKIRIMFIYELIRRLDYSKTKLKTAQVLAFEFIQQNLAQLSENLGLNKESSSMNAT